MGKALSFRIEKKIPGCLGRAGVITTPHGEIHTPAFSVVGTKGTVKALTSEQLRELGTEAVLANTYHLYLEPGDERVKKAGGLHSFMDWQGPAFTDSGGFQAFSLGAAFGKKISKIAHAKDKEENTEEDVAEAKLATIDENGVKFKSPYDGSEHFFTPERSIEIQNNIGADIIFAFDECTSPEASYEYQKEAMERTHRWAERSLSFHKKSKQADIQALFGIVQGGRFKDLREESARFLAELSLPEGGFDGFGIGGSFDKEDIGSAVAWVNEKLPEEKPRHLLGIGEPRDIFLGVENGADTFDCVAPSRQARNGTLYTKDGRINLMNAKFTDDFSPIETDCACYTCSHHTRGYLSHLFRSKEMLAGTLATIHNLHFILETMREIRKSILEERFSAYKSEFLLRYYKNEI